MSESKEDLKLSAKDVQTILSNSTPVFGPGAGGRMRLVRMDNLLDQRSAAKSLGVPYSVVSNIENGAAVSKKPISCEAMIRVFGVRATVYILTGAGSDNYVERGQSIIEKYWKTKHAPKGDRTKWDERKNEKAMSFRINKLEAQIEFAEKRIRDLNKKEREKSNKTD